MPLAIALIGVALIGVGSYVLLGTGSTSGPSAVAVDEAPARPEDTGSDGTSDTNADTNDTPPNDDPSEEDDDGMDSLAATPQTETEERDAATTEDLEPTIVEGSATYLTPNRQEHTVDITFTVTNGIVSDAEVTYDESDGYSNSHQERFDAAYKAEVIGTALNNVSLSRVGGASLTSEAFNEAAAAAAAALEA